MENHAFMLIDGLWTGADVEGPRTGVCIDPATGERAGSFSDAGAEDALAAVAAARRVFDTGTWAHSPRLRAQVMLEFADRLTQRRSQIADLVTRLNGKPAKDSTAEVNGAISEIRYYAGLARNIFGRVIETEPDCFSSMVREPLGVAGIILPWNAPIALLMRSLAPALASGCTAVIKSAPQTSVATALALECLSSVAELPKGAINVFTETGSAGAQALVDSVDVDVISFTGSNAVGKKIMAAAAGTLKRLSLELGGKSPSLIFPDADLNVAVGTLTAASTIIAGQMCTAASRVLVHEAIADEVRTSLAASLGNVRVGPGTDPTSQMGPLIDLANRDRVAAIVGRAADEGRMHLRGKPVDRYSKGAFLTPTLVEVSDVFSSLIQEEVFGPFLVLEVFGDEQEGIARANATRYGLSASVWTADRNLAERVSRQLQSGTVWINSYNRLMAEAETGGYRESGIGRLHGLEGLNDFLQTKHIYHQINRSVQATASLVK